MKKNQNLRNNLLLHLTVLFFGFTGILGKLIQINAVWLVWYRILIGFIGVSVYLLIVKYSVKITQKQAVKYLLSGLIIAAHWTCFFWAIKISNVSVTLATLSSATFFTALLDPLVRKKKIKMYEIFLGIFIIVGLLMIFSFETKYYLGIIIALAASLLASIFTVINGKFIETGNAKTISFYELLGGIIGITGFLLFTSSFSHFEMPQTTDLIYLLILGLICTAFTFVASIAVMKTLSAFTVSISINLEPVYGIILAFFIFGQSEKMTWGFYVGAIIILIGLFINAKLKQKERRLNNGILAKKAQPDG